MLSRMAKGTAKRRFQRLFVALTACWILFCLFIQPILLAHEGSTHYQNDLKSCYADSEDVHLRVCLAGAEDEWKRGLYTGFHAEYDKGRGWSYSWYFRVMWPFLMIETIVTPLLI